MTSTATISLHIGHKVKVRISPLMQESIGIANKHYRAGMTKIDSIRTIYPRIATLRREEIWYVIMNGVDLSSRGAVTYYYNMRKEFH